MRLWTIITCSTTISNNFEAEMQAKAKEYGIWLLPGSIFEKSEGNIYNTASVINPQEVVTRYRKNVSILSL
jgi:predicted amidohydrolase